MSEYSKGILAMIGACSIWGLTPLMYKQIDHVPATEVLAHRAIWSLIFFAALLAVQGRLGEIRSALQGRLGRIAIAAALVSINWFLLIFAIQINRVTEVSLGYYVYPLVAVVLGWLWFGEALSRAQQLAVAIAAVAVSLLAWGLGAAPRISLTLAITFGFYGVIKTELPLGPVVSVTCEMILFLPVAALLLALIYLDGPGALGANLHDSGFLIFAGPISATPLILFSYASRRVRMSTVGLLAYLNPTIQFLSAVFLFAEPFSGWHALAFGLIWLALGIYSASSILQDRAARRVSMADSGVSTTVISPASDGSAKP